MDYLSTRSISFQAVIEEEVLNQDAVNISIVAAWIFLKLSTARKHIKNWSKKQLYYVINKTWIDFNLNVHLRCLTTPFSLE